MGEPRGDFFTGPEPSALRLEHVSRSFRQGDVIVRALDDVTLTLAGGEFVAVAGPSGSARRRSSTSRAASTARTRVACSSAARTSGRSRRARSLASASSASGSSSRRNGFGSDDPADYPRITAADRVQRGEVNSLGRSYIGASLVWQAHPLVSVTGVVLVNLSDASVLFLPHVDWSLADNLSLVAGALIGIGPGLNPDKTPGSEYGAVPATLYAALKAYF